MRPSIFLAAIPLVLGCAQQSVLRTPTLPTSEPLQVRLYQPAGGMLSYELSEPAYVAIFAVRRGQGISMVFPHFLSQLDHRGQAGVNHESVRGARWFSTNSGGAYTQSSLLSHADAYYVIASKFPLPTEEMLRSPYALQHLVGADLFRASNLSDTWGALESILVAGLPDGSWSSDVYVNWRDPFTLASWVPMAYRHGCNPVRLPYWSALTYSSWCDANRRSESRTPTQVVQTPRRSPPKEPLDRDPSVPLPPEEGVARTSRSGNAASSSARTRSEPTRTTGRASTAARPRSGAAPSRAAGTRPSRAAGSRPSRAAGSKARPKPAN